MARFLPLGGKGARFGGILAKQLISNENSLCGQELAIASQMGLSW